MERTPPEISSDIIDSGIYISGGSAKIYGIADLVAKETGLKVNICEDPANTVAKGLCRIMDEPKLSSLANFLRPRTLED